MKTKKEMKVLRQWIGANEKPADITELRKDIRLYTLSDYALRFMLKRGYDTADKIYDALFLGLESLHDTNLMADATLAVKIIKEAIENKEPMIVYSDYDSDGVHSAATAVECLREAGAEVDYYMNNRFTQGYGLQVSGIDEILDQYPDTKLIITADNGIMAFEGIDYAKSKGIKVVVTDHHEQSATLPNADAVVDPKRHDCAYPCKDLCGAGVIYKLMLLLYFEMGLDEEIVHNTLDMVATATVGDIVALRGENRILVREGLKILNSMPRLGYQKLIELMTIDKIDSGTLGFKFVPTVNAIGRLEGYPGIAVDMLLSKNDQDVLKWAKYIVDLNTKRKEMTIEQFEIAEDILYEKFLKNGEKLPPVIVVASELFHEGIIGLVAGRLKEKYNRPAFAFAPHGDLYKGSARSIDGFHLKQSFDVLLEQNVMHSGGGHAKAAGLSVKEEQLEDFEKAVCELSLNYLSEKDFIKKFEIDIPILASDISIDIVYEMDILQPFGEGFREPTILLKDFKGHTRYLGEEKNHVKVTNDQLNLSVLMWSAANEYQEMGAPTHFRAIGNPSINIFNGQTNLQFMVNDMNLKPY